jgi:hypothetical protein
MRPARRNRKGGQPAAGPAAAAGDRYKWVALSNTTAAVFMSQLDKWFPPVNNNG